MKTYKRKNDPEKVMVRLDGNIQALEYKKQRLDFIEICFDNDPRCPDSATLKPEFSESGRRQAVFDGDFLIKVDDKFRVLAPQIFRQFFEEIS